MQSANTYCPQKNLGPNTDAVTRRTSSVRRNFAAISDRSPKQSPLAALLPAKETYKPKLASHTRLLGCKCPSALSFLLAKSSHLGLRKRIATALPRAENRSRNSPMNAFASKSAGASAPVLIEPRSPTTAFRGTTASEFVLPHGCQNPLPLVVPDLSGNFYVTITYTRPTKAKHRVAKPGSRSGSCVSVDLRF